MQVKRYSIESYLNTDQAFHYARKSLAKGYPAHAHDHDYFEVMLIEQGSTRHWINGRTEALEAGHLVFIRPGDAHALRADPALGCRIINVMFRVETAEHLLSRYGPDVAGRFYGARGFLPETHLLRGPRMERAVNVAQELQTSRRTLARIEEFLLTLTNRVIEPIEAVAEGAPRWLVNACAAAQNPAVFREGAAGFIRAAGRSHEHVCRKTREVLGLTPSAYVNRVRIEHAANLLAGSEDSIARIAQDCGIENLSHFYRLFRDQYGTTPMAFRREHQRDPF